VLLVIYLGHGDQQDDIVGGEFQDEPGLRTLKEYVGFSAVPCAHDDIQNSDLSLETKPELTIASGVVRPLAILNNVIMY